MPKYLAQCAAVASVLALGMSVLVLGMAGPAAAAPIYLNFENISVALGDSMAAEPFANRSTADSLASVIDAPSADASEDHTQSTHVWVSGGVLELDFDFGIEYDLTTLHFWNYHGEAYDVDDLDFTFFDASMMEVGTLLDVEPALGGSGGNPIFAEDFALAFPAKVRFVNVVLSGDNGQVDFNNLGFTGEVSVPEPATSAFGAAGALGLVALRRGVGTRRSGR